MTACGQVPKPLPEPAIVVREHIIVPTPDESLRKCTPRGPKPVVVTMTDLGRLINQLDARGNDCELKLDKTWESIDSAKNMADAPLPPAN